MNIISSTDQKYYYTAYGYLFCCCEKKGSFRLMFSQDKAYHVREDMAEVVKEIMS